VRLVLDEGQTISTVATRSRSDGQFRPAVGRSGSRQSHTWQTGFTTADINGVNDGGAASLLQQHANYNR